MLITLFIGFLIGALTILVAETFGFLFVVNRLIRKNKRLEEITSDSQVSRGLDHQQSVHFASKKQGFVWVLESDKVAQSWLVDKVPKEQKRKEILEVSPVRKHANIKDQTLILTDSDGSQTAQTAVRLKGCTIEAVSATHLPSRKWAKRYPIVVGSKTSVIYRGSKTLYIYFETSWEKESWCKALRIASCEDKERLKWFDKISIEFQNYLTSLNAGYPFFMKPSIGFYAEPVERENKLDGSSSKVRIFWKKFAKKASKTGESKPGWSLSSGREERKVTEKSRSFQDTFVASGLVKTAPTRKTSYNYVEEDMVLPLSSSLSHSGSQSHVSINSDTDADDKFSTDEGTLCWNLLISRLFFDAKKNAEMKSSIQARIQRTLSNMRTPSYIGEVICSGMNLGNLPPYIHGMRVLSTDMNEVWAFEVDIEYSGGLVLDIETRLEVCELEHQKTLDDENSESGSVGVVTADLLDECFKNQLIPEPKEEGVSKLDGLKSLKNIIPTSTNGSRWKSILNSVAKQVSQVPLSLGIRIASIRGVMRLHIKPPPSDQIWFGFTSMPDIDVNLESSVGEHKITSGHIALFLINKFKVAIRETLVLPNCESIGIPWMLAEKDDWVPRKVAPFMWLNQDAAGDMTTVSEVPNTHSDEAKTQIKSSMVSSSDHPVEKHEIPKKVDNVEQQTSESTDAVAISSSFSLPSAMSSKSQKGLKTPLLKNDRTQETYQRSIQENMEFHSPSSTINVTGERNYTTEEDESRPKRVGRKARMFDLGKKVGEKLEEKRRSIEEKSKNIVEKMRGPG